jgi:hypothetical protein
MVNVGEYNKHWKRWILLWLVVVVIVALVTPLGFLATLTGTAGLFFVFHGFLAVKQSVSSSSVQQTSIDALEGRREAVQIVGTARSVDEPFSAPLTDTDCVAWEIRVKEWNPSKDVGP